MMTPIVLAVFLIILPIAVLGPECVKIWHRLSFQDLVRCIFVNVVFGVPSHLLMTLESWLWPELDELPPQLSNIVFILGHYRSGTTSLHAAIQTPSSAGTKGGRFQIVSGCYADTVFPSYLLKCLLLRILCIPGVCNAIQGFFGSDVTAGGVHDIGGNALLEETLFLVWQYCGDMIHFFALPSLGCSCDESNLQVNERNIRYLRRCVARIAWYKQHCQAADTSKKMMYVGCPLGLSRSPALLMKAFPEAKFIVCAREPAKAFRSAVELLKHISFPQVEWNDPIFSQFLLNFYRYNTKPIYQGLADFIDGNHLHNTNSENIMVVDFKNWCKNGPEELRRLWEWLGLELGRDFSEEDCKAAMVKSSNHVNSTMSLVLASELNVQDDLDLWKNYTKILAHVDGQK